MSKGKTLLGRFNIKVLNSDGSIAREESFDNEVCEVARSMIIQNYLKILAFGLGEKEISLVDNGVDINELFRYVSLVDESSRGRTSAGPSDGAIYPVDNNDRIVGFIDKKTNVLTNDLRQGLVSRLKPESQSDWVKLEYVWGEGRSVGTFNAIAHTLVHPDLASINHQEFKYSISNTIVNLNEEPETWFVSGNFIIHGIEINGNELSFLAYDIYRKETQVYVIPNWNDRFGGAIPSFIGVFSAKINNKWLVTFVIAIEGNADHNAFLVVRNAQWDILDLGTPVSQVLYTGNAGLYLRSIDRTQLTKVDQYDLSTETKTCPTLDDLWCDYSNRYFYSCNKKEKFEWDSYYQQLIQSSYDGTIIDNINPHRILGARSNSSYFEYKEWITYAEGQDTPYINKGIVKIPLVFDKREETARKRFDPITKTEEQTLVIEYEFYLEFQYPH